MKIHRKIRFLHFKNFLILLTILSLAACSSKTSSETDPEASLVKGLEENKLETSEQRSALEEKYYKDATQAFNEELYTIAAKNFGLLRTAFPGSRYYEEAVVKTADALYESGKYEEAITSYQEYVSLYPKGKDIERASLQIARGWHRQFKGISRNQTPLDNAATAYQSFLKKFPNSDFRQEAVEDLGLVANRKSECEVEVIKFYLKKDKLQAAASRYADLKRNFPNSPALQEVDELIGEQYSEHISRIQELAAVSPKNMDQRFQTVAPLNSDSETARARLKPATEN